MACDLYCCRFGRFPRVALIATLKMASFMRVSYTLGFHQSKCISAMRRIPSTVAMYIRSYFSCIGVFLVTAMHV